MQDVKVRSGIAKKLRGSDVKLVEQRLEADAIGFVGKSPEWVLVQYAALRAGTGKDSGLACFCFLPKGSPGKWKTTAWPSDLCLIAAEESADLTALRIAQGIDAAKARLEERSALAKQDTALKQREEFLGVCAHDLRSPLGLIQTCLSMVLKSSGSQIDPMFSDLLVRAHRQSGHALTLVRDLLDVMALEQGLKPHYEVLNLNTIVNEFYQDYRIQADQKKVQFHYHNPIPHWHVLADSERIGQLLQNLFTNALKFTDSGRSIYLNVSPFQGRRKKDPPYPMVVISLKDEGKGIAHAELKKIFDRFVQIKENGREGGRGLGLSVAKQISTLHDGNIWVESEPGKGSTFFVLFPHTLTNFGVPHKRGGIKKVLIAAPPSPQREKTAQTLIEGGYQVDYADDGIEAVTRFYYQPPIALILAPELSKLSTLEVTCLLRSDPANNPVPLLLQSKAVKLPPTLLVDGVLPIDFSMEQFESAVQIKITRLLKVA
jgi:signal transduction histidine kinase